MSSICRNGTALRARNKAKQTAPVKQAIQTLTQAGTTTSPSAATPRPAISER
jgi:hypothetical protein